MQQKLIFNELFKLLEDKNLLSKHQSGFHPGDSCSCKTQLLAITHHIFLCFDGNLPLETRGVILEIPEVFGVQ